MLQIYAPSIQKAAIIDIHADQSMPMDTVWIDLLNPSLDEVRFVEGHLDIEVPSHEEMKEIEPSSRLYSEKGAFYLNATVLHNADSDHPDSAAIGFILSRGKLITVRYTEPTPFRNFLNMVERKPDACTTGEAAFTGLIEAIIDRLADLLEHVAIEMDYLSKDIFSPTAAGGRVTGRDFQGILVRVGRSGNLTSKTRESLVSIGRIVTFVYQGSAVKTGKAFRLRLKTISRDVISLGDYANFLSTKVNFLLDATLGMINIEQNAIIKIFSIAAVVFLPPTLIASIYGMNFHLMPELDWPFGYPMAIGAMIGSAILPFWYFKRKGWL